MVRVLEARTLRCYVDAPRATCCAAGLGGGLEETERQEPTRPDVRESGRGSSEGRGLAVLVVGVLSEGGGWAFGLKEVHGLVRTRARGCGSVDPDRTGDLAEECKRCDVVRCVLAATSKYATEAGAWLAGWSDRPAKIGLRRAAEEGPDGCTVRDGGAQTLSDHATATTAHARRLIDDSQTDSQSVESGRTRQTQLSVPKR